jgi:excinuclease ABC subunit C
MPRAGAVFAEAFRASGPAGTETHPDGGGRCVFFIPLRKVGLVWGAVSETDVPTPSETSAVDSAGVGVGDGVVRAHRDKTDFRVKLRELPHRPGVYLMKDRFNRVIYVGKARDLKKRVSQYFRPSRSMTADPKTRALLDSIWDLEWHTVLSEPEALLLEGRLIKEYRPRYNVSFRDDKRFLLVKVDLRDPWPRFRLTRLRVEDGSQYFGPFVHSGALRQTLAFLRKKFGVLTFGKGVPTTRELKSSTYQVPLRLADVSSEQYRERVVQACDFLDGGSKEMLNELEAQMKAAAERFDFEMAAEIRNMLEDLRKTTAPTRKFTRLSLPSTVNPEEDMRQLQDVLGLPTLPRHMECFDISNISSTYIVASMVCFRDGTSDRASYRRYRITSIQGQNDFASMAEVVRRRYARVLREAGRRARALRVAENPPEDAWVDYSQTQEEIQSGARRFGAALPDLIVVDGGRGQLSSACAELQQLGLFDIPIIGLAKEFEEIYRPGMPVPLRLPHTSGALRLLQRIRDEAHRFANGYHQLLLKRRMAESLLDDCPGMSVRRKKALLARFGSVARVRRAALEEIASVEGIGEKMAAQIVAFFHPALRAVE